MALAGVRPGSSPASAGATPVVVNQYPSYNATSNTDVPDTPTPSTRLAPSAPPPYDEALANTYDPPHPPYEVSIGSYKFYV